MAVTEWRYCPKCGKKVQMTRCEVCKGDGGFSALGGLTRTQCRNSCNMNGWLCPTHGKWY